MMIEIWEKHKHKLRQFIRTRVRTDHDCDDVLQEVLIKFWTKHDTIQDKSKILNWLYTVAKNEAVDYYRKKDNIGHIELNPDITAACDDASEENPDESKKLWPLIYSLPVKYKTVLLLGDIYGLRYKDLAQELDLSVSCVKSRVVRGRKLLEKKMHECCVFTHDKFGNITSCCEKQAYVDLLKKIKKNPSKLPPL